MKKTLLLAVAFAATTGAAMAQNGLTLLDNVDGTQTIASAISANGKYVTGRYTDNVTGFVGDWKTETRQTAATDEAEEVTWFYNVTDEGLALGYVGSQAATLSIDGTYKQYGDSSIIKDAVADGSLLVGNEYHNPYMYTHACTWDAEGNRTALPEPTDEWLGFSNFGTSAEFVSADGSVIVGTLVDDFFADPLVVWHRNLDGVTYSVDPSLSKKNYAATWDSTAPYFVFKPTGLSDNGQWVALMVQDAEYNNGIARYNLLTDELQVAYAEGYADIFGAGIADDGTMVGYYYGGAAVIWKAGEETFQTLSEAFPSIAKLAEFDQNGDHGAFQISADGRYIVGQGYETAEEEGAYNICRSYVLDTQYDGEGETTAISTTGSVKTATTTARFNANGQRINNRQRGLNIERMSDGSTRKVVVK